MAKILVVEDNAELAEMYETVLKNDGFQVVKAVDGEEGIKKMKDEHPDLVILDIVMPKVSGVEVLTAAKQDETLKKIPVFILTNVYSSEDNVKMLLNMGAVDYLVKSELTPGQVVEKVRKILSTQQEVPQNPQ